MINDAQTVRQNYFFQISVLVEGLCADLRDACRHRIAFSLARARIINQSRSVGIEYNAVLRLIFFIPRADVDIVQRSATRKNSVVKLSQLPRKRNRSKTRAVSKRIGSDFRHAVRNDHFGDSGTVCKRIGADLIQFAVFSKRDTGDGRTIIERIVADPLHRIRHLDHAGSRQRAIYQFRKVAVVNDTVFGSVYIAAFFNIDLCQQLTSGEHTSSCKRLQHCFAVGSGILRHSGGEIQFRQGHARGKRLVADRHPVLRFTVLLKDYAGKRVAPVESLFSDCGTIDYRR